ncbi:MAG: choline dehydrogenase [Gammaproteobacteria bacterium]|nr:choline dehydrogenase [Gammaproteobacteria bacterium]MDD9814923.1 choline dehydrogenase [Gammaproteobacteria bacterium]
MGEAFDYIIVGAGSAGCVLANRLSAGGGCSVLLLEAGGRDRNPWIHIPVGYFKTMHNPATDWCHVTEPDPGINGRRMKWPRGKVLGGSSSINGLLYIRGHRADYDAWAAAGNPGWSYREVLPLFKRAEDQQRGADEFHGRGGPLKVSDMRIQREICDAYIRAASEAGIAPNDDFNGAVQEGAGYFQLTAHRGLRWSTARGYLRPALKRGNLTVCTRALAHRVTITNGRAAAVEFSARGEGLRRAACRREIILAAGAVNSPQLLQLSGIGDGAHLQSLNIAVARDLPGVGGNLQDHLQIRAVYKSSRPTLNNEVRNPLKKIRIGLQYLLLRSGPMTMGASQVCVFARSEENLTRPDIQFHFQPLSSDSPGEGLHKFAAFTSSVCQLRPRSRGCIKIKSADAAAHPAIFPNYLGDAEDQRIAVAGMRVSRRIMQARAIRDYATEELLPGAQLQSDSELLQHARETGTTIYHPVGTCMMGPAGDRHAVVDARLRVHGIAGLRVADASIMPAIPSGNTNAPVIMIAEKAAEMVAEDNR